METLTIDAIFEDGALRPLGPRPVQNHEKVVLQVIRQSAVQETSRLLQGLDPQIVQEVAEGDEYSLLT
jgi:predicted DNA-binding antitoxin AbrB/MazE fold protein